MYASDATVEGLTRSTPDALRYDGQSDDRDEVAGVFRKLMPEGVRVLDVGCGTGSVTLIANYQKNNEVAAVEPNFDRCELARSRGLQVENGFLDAEYVAGHGMFDVVMSSDVLEHLVDPNAGLKSFISAVNPGGLLLVSVPNVAHWSVRINLIRGKFQYEDCGIMDSTHLRWFTRDSIINLFHSCDLEIEQLRVTAGFDLPVYNRGILRRVPRRLRQLFLRMGIRIAPSLFACQYVVAARPRNQ